MDRFKNPMLVASILLLISDVNLQVDNCPTSCDTEQCITDLDQDSCPQVQSDDYQYVYQLNKLCGCCPRCVRMLKYNAVCSSQDDPPCSPGLKCSVNDKCETPKNASDENCWTSHYPPSEGAAKRPPNCLSDGSYHPVQCKGEPGTGRCFCSDVNGDRIFGQQWWSKAENMTCACSRRVQELRRDTLRLDVSLHCDREGNFEALQCDDGICWCAESNTGQPESYLIPDMMMQMLPCYDIYSAGTHYLRKCESIDIAQGRIRAEMYAHGTLYDNMPILKCDRDGSYGSYEIRDTQVFCKWRNNTDINPFQDNLNQIHLMDCYCARDKEIYKEAGEVHSLVCSQNGNYSPLQARGDETFCVDSDGFVDGRDAEKQCKEEAS